MGDRALIQLTYDGNSNNPVQQPLFLRGCPLGVPTPSKGNGPHKVGRLGYAG